MPNDPQGFKVPSPPVSLAFLLRDLRVQKGFLIQRDGTQVVTFPVLSQVGREDIWVKESLPLQMSSCETLLPLSIKEAKTVFSYSKHFI